MLAEVVANPLSDLIRRPPVAVVIIDLIGAHDLLGSLDDHLGRDLRSVHPPHPGVHLGELDVQPHDLVLSRYNHHAAVRGAVDHGSVSDVGCWDAVSKQPPRMRKYYHLRKSVIGTISNTPLSRQ